MDPSKLKKRTPEKDAPSKSKKVSSGKKNTDKRNAVINDDMSQYMDIDQNPDEMVDIFSDSSGKTGKRNKLKNTKFAKWWNRRKKWQKVLMIVALVIIVLAAVALIVIYSVLGGFSGIGLNKSKLGINDNSKYNKTGYVNIAIFGLDTRDDSFTGRSDSIIIASVNKKTGDIKLTSILRDSYVAIDGYENQKITHAYALGGAELAIKTINENFNMNIEDYVSFNFAKLAGLIDYVGGIDVEISETERREMNVIGNDSSGWKNVTSSGKVHLNGLQSVVYARIRHTDSDVERVGRQKKVIMALIDNVKKMGITDYSGFVKKCMEFCETSMSASEILSYTSMLSKDITMETLVIPGDDENAIGGMYGGAWVWRYDLGLAANHIHKFIYGSAATTVAATTTTEAATSYYYKTTTKTTTTTTTTTKPSTTTTTETTTTNPDETTTGDGDTTTITTTKTDPEQIGKQVKNIISGVIGQ